jgi:hypothetical protein
MGGVHSAPFTGGRRAEQEFHAPRRENLMIHQLGITRHDHDGRHITDCPEGHNPAMFIARIEKNISPTPERQ